MCLFPTVSVTGSRRVPTAVLMGCGRADEFSCTREPGWEESGGVPHRLLQMREDLQRGAGDVNMVEIVWTDPSWLEWDFFIQTQRH